jgi:hypothetical protein
MRSPRIEIEPEKPQPADQGIEKSNKKRQLRQLLRGGGLFPNFRSLPNRFDLSQIDRSKLDL